MNRTMSRTFMKTQSLLLLALLFSLVPPLSLQAQQVVEFDSPGNGSFTVPANVRSITVEVWGGGGGSGGSVSRSLFGGGVEAGGGGGGAYASRSFGGVSVGQTFAYRVGSGGSNSAAGDSSWFGSPSTLLAQGGAGVSTNNTSGGAGGRAVSSVGDAAFSGGRGATPVEMVVAVVVPQALVLRETMARAVRAGAQ